MSSYPSCPAARELRPAPGRPGPPHRQSALDKPAASGHTSVMATSANKGTKAILLRLLERLYAAMLQGPCLNCRVHHSRQRVDLQALQALQHVAPSDLLPQILTAGQSIEVKAKAPVYRGPEDDTRLTGEQRAIRQAFGQQDALLMRLRDIAADARDYEQATGENALFIGYPLLSVPPGAGLLQKGSFASRVLAPLALIAVNLEVQRGARPAAGLAAKGSGIDLIIPNFPLLAWLERQTGKDTSDLFGDEEGVQPYREINEIVRQVCSLLGCPSPAELTPETRLQPVPRTEQLPDAITILPSAVLGLFPLSNEGLLRDLQALAEGGDLSGPVGYFLSANPVAAQEPAPAPATERRFTEERLVTEADPFQARAVRLSKSHPLLVIHGPPGTGKSQTITNIIGDHLGRGERVLLVCDKRTAIDVVKNRLDHIGLGHLCAVVHDPQRDQKPLYLKIRDHLDALPDLKTNAGSVAELEAVDAEMQEVYRRLQECQGALCAPPGPGQPSFHELVGEWFSLRDTAGLEPALLEGARLEDLAPARRCLVETLDRACEVDYPRNPWVPAAGLDLHAFLQHSTEEWRATLKDLETKAEEFDRQCGGQPPALVLNQPLAEQATQREQLAGALEGLQRSGLAAAAAQWFDKSPGVVAQTLQQFRNLEPALQLIQTTPLDAGLRSAASAAGWPPMSGITQAITDLESYLAAAGKWYGFLAFGAKSAAQAVAARHGLAISPATGAQLKAFYEGLKARLVTQEFYERTLKPLTGAPGPAAAQPLEDAGLLTLLQKQEAMLRAVQAIQASPALPPLDQALRAALGQAPAAFAQALRASAARARRLAALLEDLKARSLLAHGWRLELDAALRQNEAAAPRLARLAGHFPSLEDVLRLAQTRAQLPAALHRAAAHLMQTSADGASGWLRLHKSLLTLALRSRIQASPTLQQVDQARLLKYFQRFGELERRKQELMRDTILHRWISRQQERLLAGTRTQLNALGASLKRRLLTRGERAMKLRPMILQGAQGGEPDPLFDVCPVWMASPATVAQIFPRAALFDAIIFDEASQCRLEEAIPVLTRGRRVVIAGDPQQLPPTRFFESALIESETEEPEDDESLFEQQQSETEDLLTAALNIQIQQSCLDVHYRSRHEALIEFSNRNFYQNRLQPIPSHPSLTQRPCPIRFLRVDGLCEKRGNQREAAAVCQLVRELLDQPEPPSIGVACFNLVQRDLILDQLDQMAEADAVFAGKLETARQRRGAATFEGLFVKNLENVQGDERDHLIISTTFGPDAQGRFRRNFGPICRSGGGRRLNVLVTRAREMIHVVTSIPRQEYAVLPEIQPGQAPNGRWLLYAYLQYAEQLASAAAPPAPAATALPEAPAADGQAPAAENAAKPLPAPAPAAPAPAAPEKEKTSRAPAARPASKLVDSLAQLLARKHGVPCETLWGSEGFCVDLVLRTATPAGPVTLGVLCDMTRFPAPDPVEWELFRTAMLQRQGWTLYRLWSPNLFVDAERHEKAILKAAKAG